MIKHQVLKFRLWQSGELPKADIPRHFMISKGLRSGLYNIAFAAESVLQTLVTLGSHVGQSIHIGQSVNLGRLAGLFTAYFQRRVSSGVPPELGSSSGLRADAKCL